MRGGLQLSAGAGVSLVAQARELVGRVKTIDEAKLHRDKAASIAYIARERGESIELVQDAIEARMWLERRIGQLTAAMPKASKAEAGAHGAKMRQGKAGITQILATKAAALEQAKISKLQASKWERLARVPERDFVRQAREAATKVRTVAAGEKKKPQSEQAMRTPLWFFNFLNAWLAWPFVCDAYASMENALCPRFITKAQDANKTDWPDGTFGNPEFDDMSLPMAQARRQAAQGRRSLIVGPAPVAQQWVHEHGIHGTEVRPDGRISFDNPDGTPTRDADRDTALWLFGPGYDNPNAARGIFHVIALKLPPLHERAAWAEGAGR